MKRTPDLIEQVKTLRRIGYSWNKIHAETGIPVGTARKWATLPDEPGQADAREKFVVEYQEQGRRLVKANLDILERDTLAQEIKPLDRAKIIGIITDKLEVIGHPKSGDGNGRTLVTINLLPNQPGRGAVIDADELSPLPGEVPGDDMRVGCGQNLQRMLGSGQDVTGVPED